jgi:2'-5' RNA ligase
MYRAEPEPIGRRHDSPPNRHGETAWVRCFLAVPIAEPALAAVERLQAELRERVAGVGWARPETLHLTVHFFGQIDEDRAATALNGVTPIVERTPPFDVVLDRVGAFPEKGIPRVLWLGPAREIPQLTALALECRAVLAASGFEVEPRRYHAHCTLGRPRRNFSSDASAAWAAASAWDRVNATFTASRLVLYESRPAPGGARYTERSSLAFA